MAGRPGRARGRRHDRGHRHPGPQPAQPRPRRARGSLGHRRRRARPRRRHEDASSSIDPAADIADGSDFTTVITYGGTPEPIQRGHRHLRSRLADRRAGGLRGVRAVGGADVLPGERPPHRQGHLHDPRHRAGGPDGRRQRPARRGERHRSRHALLDLRGIRPDGQLPRADRHRRLRAHRRRDRWATSRSATPSTGRWLDEAAEADRGHGGHDRRCSTTSTGRIPFEAYGVLAVDEALGFALETQTLTIIGSDIAADRRASRPDPPARARAPVGGRRREPRHVEGHLAERGLRHLRRVALARAHRAGLGGRLGRAVRGSVRARPTAGRPGSRRAVRRSASTSEAG